MFVEIRITAALLFADTKVINMTIIIALNFVLMFFIDFDFYFLMLQTSHRVVMIELFQNEFHVK